MKIHHILLAVLLSSVTLCAQPQPVPEEVPPPPPIMPPAAAPLKMSIKEVSRWFDNIPIQEYQITTEDWVASMPRMRQWSFAKPDSDESLVLRERMSPEHHLSFTLYPSGVYLTNLDNETVLGYIEGLKKIHRDRFELLNEGKHRPKEVPFIMSAQWRIVDYKIKGIDDPENPVPDIQIVDYLVFPNRGDQLMRIRLSGQPESIKESRGMVQAKLFRLHKLAEDEIR